MRASSTVVCLSLRLVCRSLRSNIFYAVKRGRNTGVFYNWLDCKAQVNGFTGARFKKFHVYEDAVNYAEIVLEVVRSSVKENMWEATTGPVPGPSRMRRDDDHDGERGPLTNNGEIGKDEDTTDTETDTDRENDVPTEAEDDMQRRSYPLAPRLTGKEREESSPTIANQQYGDLIVYCDGSCRGNGGPGAVAGIGIWWGDDDKRNVSERVPGLQTNNCAELFAIVRVLEDTSIDLKRKLIIRTDSRYSIDCLTNWINNWRKSGTQLLKRNGDVVLNSQLILYAFALLECRKDIGQRVEFEHVRGHCGNAGNNEADRLANLGGMKETDRKDDWVASEETYREWARLSRQELIERGSAYLRRTRDAKLDIITTSQEAREIGGYTVPKRKPGPSGTTTSASTTPTKTEQAKATTTPVAGPSNTNQGRTHIGHLAFTPVGVAQRYRSDLSARSDSPTPQGTPQGTPRSQDDDLGNDVLALLRAKRAGKSTPNTPNSRFKPASTTPSVANTRYQPTTTTSTNASFIPASQTRRDRRPEDDEGVDPELAAYAAGLADDDLLEEDLISD